MPICEFQQHCSAHFPSWGRRDLCGLTEGCREENLLGVTRQRNHIRLQDSLERKTVGGQDSLCGKYRHDLQLNQKTFLTSLQAFPYCQVQRHWKHALLGGLLVMCFVTINSLHWVFRYLWPSLKPIFWLFPLPISEKTEDLSQAKSPTFPDWFFSEAFTRIIVLQLPISGCTNSHQQYWSSTESLLSQHRHLKREKKLSPLQNYQSKSKKIRKERAKSICAKCNTIWLYGEPSGGNSKLPYTHLKIIKADISSQELDHSERVIYICGINAVSKGPVTDFRGEVGIRSSQNCPLPPASSHPPSITWVFLDLQLC